MRGVSILLLAASAAGCTAVPEGVPTRTAEQQQHFVRLTGDKLAGPPVACLASYQQNDMSVLDSRTVAFQRTSSVVNIVHLSPGCELLRSGAFALQTHSFGQGLCSGDIAQVIDTMNRGMSVGSCTIGPIIPYRRP